MQQWLVDNITNTQGSLIHKGAFFCCLARLVVAEGGLVYRSSTDVLWSALISAWSVCGANMMRQQGRLSLWITFNETVGNWLSRSLDFARDDGIYFVAIPCCHFDRSGAKWRNLGSRQANAINPAVMLVKHSGASGTSHPTHNVSQENCLMRRSFCTDIEQKKYCHRTNLQQYLDVVI